MQSFLCSIIKARKKSEVELLVLALLLHIFVSFLGQLNNRHNFSPHVSEIRSQESSKTAINNVIMAFELVERNSCSTLISSTYYDIFAFNSKWTYQEGQTILSIQLLTIDFEERGRAHYRPLY